MVISGITLWLATRLTGVVDESDGSRALSLAVVKLRHFAATRALLALEVHLQVVVRHAGRNSAHFHRAGRHAGAVVCPWSDLDVV